MMEKIMKRTLAAFLMLMAAWIIASGYPLSVRAQDGAEEMQSGQLMKALQHVDAKAEPNDDAETVFSYENGAHVYVTGETVNGWLIVNYQGQTGYIKNNASQIVLEVEELDIKSLDEELAALEVENKLFIEEVERYLSEARRSKIWGAVIVLLVIGIFVVGIVSTVGTEKRKKEE